MSGILIFGGLMIDQYYMIDRFPRRGQDGIITNSLEFVGGCAINMATTIKNLGGHPYVVSYLGNDEKGKRCLDYLKNQGMSSDCVQIENSVKQAETGYCLVFVEPDGERTFLTKEGIEGKFDDSLLSEAIINECNVVAVTGYYLIGNEGEKKVAVLKDLKKNGYRIVFDPSPLVSYIDVPVLTKIIELSDLIVPNWEESKYLAELGKDNAESPDRLKWAKAKADSGTLIVLTMGEVGGIVFHKSGSFEYNSIPVEVIDSTGAGDSFVGALAYGISKDWDFKKSLAVATRCAALIVGINGPHGNFTTNWVDEL
ncbi:MAG TPA: carbohydrate kinase family protein [Anaerovoracaceae bacterium]|nr:carbohydrate kinase family protein [Anaerovoracaceae bacterium]